MLGRRAPALLGTVLTAAGVCAGGGPAMALEPGTGHQNVRAEVLALLGHHGIGSPLLGSARGGGGALALPPGVRPVVSPGTFAKLSGVFCTSVTNCWAVGSFENAAGATLNQILHWNGTKWSRVTAVPSPGGTAQGNFSALAAVRCRTASDCWTVGAYSRGAAMLNQALHWNGSKWAMVPVANPAGTAANSQNALGDVVCPT